jgi:hypothetical protein
MDKSSHRPPQANERPPVGARKVIREAVRSSSPCALAFVVLSLVTLAEVRLIDRLLFVDQAEYGFVLHNVRGILAGTPVWKAWQNRLLGPAAVTALSWATGDPLSALKLFGGLMIVGANSLLYVLLRRKGATSAAGLLGVVAFGFARLVLVYKLEYPWDGVDVLLFLAFGYWAARDGALLRFAPLLVVGAINHETALYIPLWYLLAPLGRTKSSLRLGRELVMAAVLIVVVAGGMLALRQACYVGRPDLPGQAFENATPLIENPIHFDHNARQFLVENWKQGRIFISATLVCAFAWLIRLAAGTKHRRSGVWSLVVLVSVFLFGYVNETRLYLPLLAFWFTYAWPAPMPSETAGSSRAQTRAARAL